MRYYFSKILNVSFDKAIEEVVTELKKEGFGVLTEIDIKEKLKEKLDIDYKKYKIFGACNPSLAYKALQAEENIGLMLPCNVIVKEGDEGKSEVAVIDPIASMVVVDNPQLMSIAEEVKERMSRVVENL